MMLRKIAGIFLVAVTTVSMSGCSMNTNAADSTESADSIGTIVQTAIENDKDVLATPIVHEVYSYEGLTDASVVSVYNTVGDISVTQSEDNQVRVVVSLIQTKTITDLDTKLYNLQIVPQNSNNVLFYEPLAKNGTTNYWEWIHGNSNANGIKIDFEIQIPTTVQEVRIFNEQGDINLNAVTARIYAQTDLGVITGQNITPLDTATFITNLPSRTGKTGIDISFSSFEYTNEITAGISLHDIVLTVPTGAQYTYETDSNMTTEYSEQMYSRFDYCREQCLEEFKPIQTRQGETVITTTEEEALNRVTMK